MVYAIQVGVAVVPPTGDPLVDLLLSLPSDAVTEMPVHLAFACRSWAQLERQLCQDRDGTIERRRRKKGANMR